MLYVHMYLHSVDGHRWCGLQIRNMLVVWSSCWTGVPRSTIRMMWGHFEKLGWCLLVLAQCGWYSVYVCGWCGCVHEGCEFVYGFEKCPSDYWCQSVHMKYWMLDGCRECLDWVMHVGSHLNTVWPYKWVHFMQKCCLFYVLHKCCNSLTCCIFQTL